MKRKKVPPKLPEDTNPDRHVFEIESVLLMSSLGFDIRDAIMKKAISKAGDNKKVPAKCVQEAIKELKLDRFLVDRT